MIVLSYQHVWKEKKTYGIEILLLFVVEYIGRPFLVGKGEVERSIKKQHTCLAHSFNAKYHVWHIVKTVKDSEYIHTILNGKVTEPNEIISKVRKQNRHKNN